MCRREEGTGRGLVLWALESGPGGTSGDTQSCLEGARAPQTRAEPPLHLLQSQGRSRGPCWVQSQGPCSVQSRGHARCRAGGHARCRAAMAAEPPQSTL